MPRNQHVVMRPLKPGRTIIIGDVHGCAGELKELVARLAIQPDDNVVFAGDLVNKGPRSVEVLQVFRELGAQAVRGNHDDNVLATWHRWTEKGVEPKKRQAWAKDMSAEDAATLEALPLSVSLPELGVLVVHAGVAPGVPLERHDPWTLYKMRNLVHRDERRRQLQQQGGEGEAPVPEPDPDHERQLPGGWVSLEKPKQGGAAWASLWQGPQHVFFGHDAKRGLQLETFATGLDTGCVYGRQLTCAVIPPLSQLASGAAGNWARVQAQSGRHSSGAGTSGGAGGQGGPQGAPTREDLGVVFEVVPAAEVYEQPSRPEPAKVAEASDSVAAPAAG